MVARGGDGGGCGEYNDGDDDGNAAVEVEAAAAAAVAYHDPGLLLMEARKVFLGRKSHLLIPSRMVVKERGKKALVEAKTRARLGCVRAVTWGRVTDEPSILLRKSQECLRRMRTEAALDLMICDR